MSLKLSSIRAFTALGVPLIPLRGKVPTTRDWINTKPGAFSVEQLAGGNYGVVLGSQFLVIDVDPRNFAPNDRPLVRLRELVGKLDSFTVRTGGGGLHVYFRLPPGVVSIAGALKEFPGVEFKSGGRQVVGPGSIHDSGQEYVVAAGSIDKITEVPRELLALLSQPSVPFAEVSSGTGAYVDDEATQGRYVGYLKSTEPAVEGKRGDETAFKTACHGRDLGLSPTITWELLLAHWNERCSPPWEAEELKLKVIHAYKYAKGAVGSSHPSADFAPVADGAAKEPEPTIAWVLKNDKVVKCFQNLMNYLRLPAGGLSKVFAFNEFTGRYEFVRPAPWHRGKMPTYRGVGDNDLKLLKGYLATRHGYEAAVDPIEEAITNIAYHDRFHPVRAYLSGLVWDGKPRLDFWLRDFLGAEDTAYSRAVGAKTLCAAVKRVFEPGIKFDHVLILEGAQDLGKSGAIAILGGGWAADAPIDPHSRDTVDMMQGRWIIELAEMEVTRRTDEEALKAFITRKTDLARLAYGRATAEFPRQSIFIATKNPRNDGTYLKDETGNRRWWPVHCEASSKSKLGQIDFAGLEKARDQLFAEAVIRARQMKHYRELSMDTNDLKEDAKKEAALRHAEHEWTERIAAWVNECDQRAETRREFVTGREIFIEAMGGADRFFDRRSMMSIASVMKTLGWETHLKWVRDRPVRGYLRASGAPKVRPASVDELVAAL